jgi:hypothetical protein
MEQPKTPKVLAQFLLAILSSTTERGSKEENMLTF